MAKTCPKCNRPIPADAPGGVCPYCVLENALFDRGPQASTLTPESERDLVFSLFAVQMGAVSPALFIQVGMEWIADPQVGLAQRLCQAGTIAEDKIALVWSLTDAAIRHHRGNVRDTLGDMQAEQVVSDLFDMALGESRLGQRTHLGLPLAVDSDVSDPGAIQEMPGRYTRKSEYSRGGMGRILLVHDQFLTRDVALKELLPSRLTGTPESGKETPVRRAAAMVARFLREAKVTGQLEHPNIVPVYELGQRKDGNFFYTMKLIRGESMAVLLAKAKTPAERLAYLPNFIDLCQALAYAHSRRVIHRDIKPSNVMIGPFGETVLIDWGLAKILGQPDPLADEVASRVEAMHDQDSVDGFETRPGARMGTPAYMSPEQARGEVDELDARSDVFNLGAMLYEMLTGSTPFGNLPPSALMHKVAYEDAPRPETVARDVAPELAAICAKAMKRNPAERYGDAEELVKDLEQFVSGALVSAYRYSLPDLAKRYYRRHKAAVLTAGAAAALLAVGAVFAYVRIYDERNQAVTARAEAESYAYLSGIRLAEREIEGRNFDSALETLAEAPEALRGWEWNHLMLRAKPSLHAFEGYNTVSWSPDGARVVLAGVNKPLLYADAATGAAIREIPTNMPRPNGVAHAPNGAAAALFGADGVVRIVDLNGVAETRELGGHVGAIFGAAWAPDGQRLATYGTDGRTLLRELASGALVADIAREGFYVLCEGFDRSGRYLYGRTLPREEAGEEAAPGVWVWDTAAGAMAFETPGAVLAVDGAAERAYVAVGAAVQVWSLAPEAAMAEERPAGSRPLTVLALSGDGAQLATADETGAAILWDAASGAEMVRLPNREALKHLTFSTDGALLLAASSAEPTVRIWEAATGALVATHIGHRSMLLTAGFSPDGLRTATTGADNLTRIWAAADESASSLVYHATGYGQTLSASPTGDAVLVGSAGRYAVVDTASGAVERLIQAKPYGVGGAAGFLTADGRHAVVLADHVTPAVVDRATGETAALVREHDGPVYGLAPSSDGVTAFSVDWSGRALQWRVATGEILARVALAEGIPSAIAAGTGATMAYIGTEEGAVYRWDAASVDAPSLIGAAGAPIAALALAPGGSIVAGCRNGAVAALDEGTGEVRNVEASTQAILGLVFAEGRLFTSSQAGNVSMWSWPALRRLADFPTAAGRSRVWAVAAVGENDIVTLAQDGEARRWRFAETAGAPPSRWNASEPAEVLGWTTAEDAAWLRDHLAGGAPLPRTVGEVHPLRWFGLQVGETVTAVGDTPVGDDAALVAALTTALSQGEAMPVIAASMGERERRYEWQAVRKTDTTREISVGASELADALALHATKLRRQENSGGSIAYASYHGIDGGRSDWPLGMPLGQDSLSDAQDLRSLGLAPFDVVLTINNQPIRSEQNYLDAAAEVSTMMRSGVANSVSMYVERGALKRVELVYAISPQ